MLVLISLACLILQTAKRANLRRTPSGRRNKAFGGKFGDNTLMKSFETLVGKTTSAVIRDDRQIKQVISQIVPVNTMEHIEFCRVEGGRMRVTIDSAAWISRLRFIERQLIDVLRGQHLDVHTISYHVAPAEKPIVRKTLRSARKASKGASTLEATAASVADAGDDRLRQELLKLARQLRGEKG